MVKGKFRESVDLAFQPQKEQNPSMRNFLLNFTSLYLISFLIISLLMVFGKLSNQEFLIIALFLVGSISIKNFLELYLNFVLGVRNIPVGFPDNRSANFLTFDMFKFMLILIALIVIVTLGLNKILNNETIATLLGGLVGSLLTMIPSYSDVKLSKDDLEILKQNQQNKNPQNSP